MFEWSHTTQPVKLLERRCDTAQPAKTPRRWSHTTQPVKLLERRCTQRNPLSHQGEQNSGNPTQINNVATHNVATPLISKTIIIIQVNLINHRPCLHFADMKGSSSSRFDLSALCIDECHTEMCHSKGFCLTASIQSTGCIVVNVSCSPYQN